MDKAINNQRQSSDTEPLDCIEGVQCIDLKIIPHKDGAVLHMLRVDVPFFSQFGEIYFSELEPQSIKAWKMHTKQSQHLVVPHGELYDARQNSRTSAIVQEVILGRKHYKLLCIPPNVWYGFINQSDNLAIICNCTDLVHDPTESLQKNMDDPTIPYKWG